MRLRNIKILPAMVAGWLIVGASCALAADVGVSVSVSQPGVYGRIDLGRFPQPQVVVTQPVVVGPPVAVAPQPVYMWVPPGHRKHWAKNCWRYNACGTPVYFVRDDWYRSHVAPQAQGPVGRYPTGPGFSGRRDRGGDFDRPSRGRGHGPGADRGRSRGG